MVLLYNHLLAQGVFSPKNIVPACFIKGKFKWIFCHNFKVFRCYFIHKFNCFFHIWSDNYNTLSSIDFFAISYLLKFSKKLSTLLLVFFAKFSQVVIKIELAIHHVQLERVNLLLYNLPLHFHLLKSISPGPAIISIFTSPKPFFSSCYKIFPGPVITSTLGIVLFHKP